MPTSKPNASKDHSDTARVFPPFVDAYAYPTTKPWTRDDYESALLAKAQEWGETSIGCAVLRTGEPAKIGEAYVCAIGWSNKFGRLAATTTDGVKFKVVPYDWPDEWDVT